MGLASLNNFHVLKALCEATDLFLSHLILTTIYGRHYYNPIFIWGDWDSESISNSYTSLSKLFVKSIIFLSQSCSFQITEGAWLLILPKINPEGTKEKKWKSLWENSKPWQSWAYVKYATMIQYLSIYQCNLPH